MDEQVVVRHGQLVDVTGRSVRFDDVSIIPAEIILDGNWFEPELHLKDYLKDLPRTTVDFIQPGSDAAWVLGRLIMLFHIPRIPSAERLEKTCFVATFVAVLHDHDNFAIPFECSDYYGRSSLTFSTNDPPDPKLKLAIATAFWGLLTSAPHELEDYADKLFHSGAGVWIEFGVELGQPFMVESEEA